MSENLIIFNARIVTPIGFSARKGEEMSQLQVIENGTVEVTKGVITYVGENTPSCPASSIPIPISCLAENVPKNSPGV